MAKGPSNRPSNRAAKQLWLVPVQGQAATGVVAEVALRIPLRRTLTYAVPEQLQPGISPGARLRVPYGRSGRLVEAICVRTGPGAWNHTLRTVAAVIEHESRLPPALIELGLWLAEYYHCPPGGALASLLPQSLRKPPSRKVVYAHLAHSGASAAVDSSSVAESDHKLTSRQNAVMAVLRARGPLAIRDLAEAAHVSSAVVKKLASRGLLKLETRTEPRRLDPASIFTRDAAAPEERFELNPGQQAAVERIIAGAVRNPSFRAFLLYGVTGSGKTEVYVRAMRELISGGRQAVMIVPEIALATQLVDRLARRFDRVAVMHSRLAQAARAGMLRAISAGEIDVVIGTRSAVFSPLPALGLIVVDEEQDASLKSPSSPRYHARDAAIKRAQIENIPVVLGSATPALETWHNAQAMPHFELLRLTERVGGAVLPEIRAVRVSKRDGAGLISAELYEGIRAALDSGQQAILLHNRRGYAMLLKCAACGLPIRCERCGHHMVFHRADGEIKCHNCGMATPPPQQCLDITCKGKLERSGMAIQRLEEELAHEFPSARVLRLDSDAMKRREDYRTALHSFERREADILIGTQMVAKGLDFPSVRLVGVIEADAGLFLPDFRAAERTFQLVYQVVGRAGRREGRSVAVVQSTTTDLPAIRFALELSYEGFAASELRVRSKFFYPPYSRLVRFVCSDSRPGRARHEARSLAEKLRACAARVSAAVQIGDAAECVVGRSRERFRYHVLARCARDGSAQRLLENAERQKVLRPPVQRFMIDVDPIDLL